MLRTQLTDGQRHELETLAFAAVTASSGMARCPSTAGASAAGGFGGQQQNSSDHLPLAGPLSEHNLIERIWGLMKTAVAANRLAGSMDVLT